MPMYSVAVAIFIVFSIGFIIGRNTKEDSAQEVSGKIVIYKLDEDVYLYLDGATPNTISGKTTVTFKVEEVTVPPIVSSRTLKDHLHP